MTEKSRAEDKAKENIKKIQTEERAKENIKRIQTELQSSRTKEKSEAPISTNPDAKVSILLEKMKSRRIILQGWDKVTFEGDLVDFCEGFFILNKVTITGNKNKVSPPWAIVDRKTISHIHPVCEVFPLKKDDNQ